VNSVGTGAIPGGGAGKRREEAASAPKAETKWRTASAVAGAGARRSHLRPAMPGTGCGVSSDRRGPRRRIAPRRCRHSIGNGLNAIEVTTERLPLQRGQVVQQDSGGFGGPRPDQSMAFSDAGVGSRLLELTLPGQIHANASIDYRPDGVRVHWSVPIPVGAVNQRGGLQIHPPQYGCRIF
jgi:hypothetical protein